MKPYDVVMKNIEKSPGENVNISKYGSELRHYISKKRVQRNEIHRRSSSTKIHNHMYSSLRSDRSLAEGF